VALRPSTAETPYVVLSFGVVTVPPNDIAAPLTVIEELFKEELGTLLIVLTEPDIVDCSSVLLVNVCAVVR